MAGLIAASGTMLGLVVALANLAQVDGLNGDSTFELVANGGLAAVSLSALVYVVRAMANGKLVPKPINELLENQRAELAAAEQLRLQQATDHQKVIDSLVSLHEAEAKRADRYHDLMARIVNLQRGGT